LSHGPVKTRGGLTLKLSIFGLAAGLFLPLVSAAGAVDAESYKILRLDGNNVRWQPVSGKAPVISYAIATRQMDFPGARNCQKIAAPDELLAASALTIATFREEIAAAFAMWQAVADIHFREADSLDEADIVLGAQVEPTGHAFADVFYDAASRERLKPISKALVCLNPSKAWKIGFNGDLRTYDIRYTIAHEIGHAIGLDHPNGAGQIMGYRYEERFRQLQPGDVAGAVVLYGGARGDGVEVAAEATDPEQGSVARGLAKNSGTRAFPARPQ
jgi:Matrixin